MESKDYYKVLGVDIAASHYEIKTAYRKLSKKFHSDNNEGDKFFRGTFEQLVKLSVPGKPIKKQPVKAAKKKS